MTPLDHLRRAKVTLDLFYHEHPIIRHDPHMDLARNDLAEAIERLEAAVANAITIPHERHNP